MCLESLDLKFYFKYPSKHVWEPSATGIIESMSQFESPSKGSLLSGGRPGPNKAVLPSLCCRPKRGSASLPAFLPPAPPQRPPAPTTTTRIHQDLCPRFGDADLNPDSQKEGRLPFQPPLLLSLPPPHHQDLQKMLAKCFVRTRSPALAEACKVLCSDRGRTKHFLSSCPALGSNL